MIDVGDKLPAFKASASGGQSISQKDLSGKIVVMYFYPKDSTPGCTLEAQDFRDLHKAFVKAGAVILGVSRDSVKSHDNFCSKQALPFTLLSDTDEALCKAFDVIHDKNMYGKLVRGIVRSTFLFDAKGKCRQVWRGVKVKAHAADVLAAVQAL